MIAETLSVGTELLLGQIVDTDAAFIARALAEIGVGMVFRGTVGDNHKRLREAIRLSISRCDLLITCGGLGPTMDDLTKEAVAEELGVPLIPDPEQLARLRDIAAGREDIPDSFFGQALAPQAPHGYAIPNPNGTAPGVWIEAAGKIAICLPGPPNELIPMMQESVVPQIAARLGGGRSVIRSRVLHIVGIGESRIEEMTRDLLLSENPTVAPLAGLAECKLRITARAGSEQEAERLIAPREAAIRARLGDAVYGVDGETLEYAVITLLKSKKLTAATAESCTGGLIAQRLTSVAGASDAFGTGIVAYANSAKTALLGVPEALLAAHGAVSAECAAAMAEGARAASGADIAVSVTGVAGPSGGSEEKPVGLVYISVAARAHPTTAQRHLFHGSRADINGRAATNAIAAVRTLLLRL